LDDIDRALLMHGTSLGDLRRNNSSLGDLRRNSSLTSVRNATYLPTNESTSSLRGMLGDNGGGALPRNMSYENIEMGNGMILGSSTDLNGLLRSGSHLDLGAELYEDSLLNFNRSDSIQSLDQLCLGGSSNNLQALELLAGRQAHTAHTMDSRWEW